MESCYKTYVQVGSLQEMDAKLDQLSASGGLDPALLLTLAKAHTSVKDTDYTKEEVKDVMAHLYFKVSCTLPVHTNAYCTADSLQ